MGPEATASVKAGATLGQCGAEEGKVRKLFHMSERHPMKSWEQVASLCPPTPSPRRAEPGDLGCEVASRGLCWPQAALRRDLRSFPWVAGR